MAKATNNQPLFSNGQIDQLRGVLRDEIESDHFRSIIRAVGEEVLKEKVYSFFAAIQTDLVELKEGQLQLETGQQRLEAQRLILKDHESRLKTLEPA